MTLPCKLAIALLSTIFTAAAAQQPDTIFFHGDILTGTRLRPNDRLPAATPPNPTPDPHPDPTPGRVTALAVLHGRILAAGADKDILALQSPTTRLIDLGGHFALPGFNDAHTHIAAAGQQRLAVDLTGTTSLAQAQQRIRTYIAGLPPNTAPTQWLVGGGWDHTLWPSRTLPTRQDLDAVTGAHPALLERVDGHIAVANTAALAAAGITADTPDPQGAQIDHDPHGALTGILREASALALVQAHSPPPSPETRRRALQLSIADALAHGVTSLQDFSDWDDWLVLESLERDGKLPLRVAEWVDFNLPLDVLKTRRASHDPNDPRLHLTFLKGFMDGSLGSRTAALGEDYADDPGNAGLPRYDQANLNRLATARAAAGFQLGFHAIGDLANDMALNAFAAAEQTAIPADEPPPPAHPDAAIVTSTPRVTGPADLRFRIEHAQVVLPNAFDRFHDLGVIASMQPSHLLTDMAWAGARLGPQRVQYAYAWRSFLDHDVTLAFGTDYPVESIDPFRGLYAAITRQNEAGTQTFQPQQRLTLTEALYAYTQASAFAEFRETLKGRLAPGFVCDLVVLDRDITKTTPRDLLHTRVLQTIVDGNVVYTAR